MKAVHLLLPVSVLALLILSVFAQAPYYFSSQEEINPDELTGLYDSNVKDGIFHGQLTQSMEPPPFFVQNPSNVLGTYRGDKHIEVDLTNQRLYAFEGTSKIYDFAISSGKWGRTPTGEFTIWIKLRYTRMKGGNKALGTYYDLPNVPYTMYFSNAQIPSSRGFGIHGAYWHNNFGHPMSHGCINMKTSEVEQIYYWAKPDLPENTASTRSTAENPGTKIIIYGKAPAT